MTNQSFDDIEHHYAGILIVASDGRLIGQLRDNKPGIDNPNKIATFGGTVETGESPLQAARRELVEETNLQADEDSLTLFHEDKVWRVLAMEWEVRHFYYFLISDEQLDSLEVYEGQGWVAVDSHDDPRLTPGWQVVVDQLKVLRR